MDKEEKEDVPEVVPEQQEGMIENITESREFETADKARTAYTGIKKDMLDINNWFNLSVKVPTEFILIDKSGDKVNRKPSIGDYIRINIPDPLITKYDWVQIEAIDEKTETENDYACFSIIVRPSQDPTSEEKEVKHFFDDISTNTFSVERKDKEITVGVYPRNIKPNMETSHITEKIRNEAIYLGSKFLWASVIQWRQFVQALIKNNEQN